MEHSSINPVTEAEMRTFAERMVTNFVSLSHQSIELRELKTAFTALEYRVNGLSDANDRLKAQVDILVSERDKARTEASENLELAKSYERERDVARQDIKDGQDRYDRLEANYNRSQEDYRLLYESHSKVLREGAEARNERDAKAKELETALASNVHLYNENQDMRAKLDRITKALQGVEDAKAEASEEARADITVVPVSTSPQAVGAPADEPWWKQQQQAARGY